MTDNQDFFADEQPAENQEPEKVKIGEKEYAPEDLEKFVSLGEKAAELEEKWNTKIDRLAPEYTKSRQELAELKKKIDEEERARQEKLQEKAQTGSELSPQEQEELIRQQLKKYGMVTEQEVYEKIANYQAAMELNRSIDTLLEQAKTDGKPTATRVDLLTYMDENGIKNHELAYEMMFKNELKQWEQEQVNKIKPSGLVTEPASSAGSKEPAPVKVTKDNMYELLKAELGE